MISSFTLELEIKGKHISKCLKFETLVNQSVVSACDIEILVRILLSTSFSCKPIVSNLFLPFLTRIQLIL